MQRRLRQVWSGGALAVAVIISSLILLGLQLGGVFVQAQSSPTSQPVYAPVNTSPAVQAAASPSISSASPAPAEASAPGPVGVGPTLAPDQVMRLGDPPTGMRVVDTGQGGYAMQIDAQVRGSLVDRSGSITTANTSQQVMPANPRRSYLLFQNTSSGDLWIDLNVPAVASTPAIRVVASGSMVWQRSFIPTDALNVIGATAGATFTAKEL